VAGERGDLVDARDVFAVPLYAGPEILVGIETLRIGGELCPDPRGTRLPQSAAERDDLIGRGKIVRTECRVAVFGFASV